MSGPQRILVTGASGFVGKRLVVALASQHPQAMVFANCRRWPGGVPPGVTPITLDLTDSDTPAALASLRPDILFHLGGRASVEASDKESPITVLTNTMATLALADQVRRQCPGTMFVYASSGETYGETFNSVDKARETDPLRPLGAYSRSKTAAELGLTDLLANNCPLVILRLFNHTGPGQDERFVTSAFAAQIARIEKGLAAPVVTVGNLSARRDFLDVEDVLRAYLIIASNVAKFKVGSEVYNICSGQSIEIREILNRLMARALTEIAVEIDPTKLRAADISRAVGSADKFNSAFGWHPRMSFDTTLDGIMAYWRAAV
jgi:GDP-4-dehydro-6-deoxy-D-mannose reductase